MVALAKKKLQVNLDTDIYERVNSYLDAMGLTPSTIVTMLYKKIDATGKLPFEAELTQEQLTALRLNSTIDRTVTSAQMEERIFTNPHDYFVQAEKEA